MLISALVCYSIYYMEITIFGGCSVQWRLGGEEGMLLDMSYSHRTGWDLPSSPLTLVEAVGRHFSPSSTAACLPRENLDSGKVH